MAIFSIRKWRKNSKGTGAILDLSYYDEKEKKWVNSKAHVPFAEAYAGKDAADIPPTLCKISKAGYLVIQCTKFDDYVFNTTPKGVPKGKEKANEETDEESPF